jgi:precorrin-4 C11-methyltransferase
MKRKRKREPVYFAGAGPGDPELVTLKTRRLLDEADLVIYAGSLVNPALVRNLSAEVHDSSSMDLDEIVELISRAWQEGRRVVRLHTGDPTIYGAIREQMERLSSLGIPCRIVPGVSSATAAAAAINAELTLPGVSQTVILTRRAGRTPVPKGEALDLLASHQATMCIFLSVSMIEETVEDLLAGGYPGHTPVAVVEKATWEDERTIRGTLLDIADRVRRAGIRKTAMILVGQAISSLDERVPKGAEPSRLYDPGFSHGFRPAGGGEKEREKRIALISITRQAGELAQKICDHLPGAEILPKEGAGAEKTATGTKGLIESAWNRYDALVCIMAAGIVVRAVAGLARDKRRDPAVVVVSQDGRFVVPVLSGHLGGANRLSERIAAITGGQAVITTASDVEGRTALDIWMERYALRAEDDGPLATVMKRLVERGGLRLFSELDTLPPLPPDIKRCKTAPEADIIITWRTRAGLERAEALDRPILILNPPVVAAGIGCNRGTTEAEISRAVKEAFHASGISMNCLFRAASIDIKRDEEGLRQFCQRRGIELLFFTARELNSIKDLNGSELVMKATGARAVCEPAALLAAGASGSTDRLIMEKRICKDVTVAAALDTSAWWERGRVPTGS